MSHQSPAAYRTEIDGLRAVSILSVVLYHFGVPWLGGGFVGVDVFFVISGFLIGGLLWAELEQRNTIALGAFYLRRIRRLAPAYFLVLFVTLAVSYALLLPYEFRELGKETIASTVYLSNVHFFRSAGYFDTAAEEKLLLHTWSLSVEEQFYIVLPALLILLVRGIGRGRTFAGLIALLVLSLGTCIAVTGISQPAAFYLFPFRAWELLAGVVLAIAGRRWGYTWSLHPALSWTGLGLIIGTVVAMPAGAVFPGIYAVPPVLGAVLLIANGKNANPVNRLLSSRPFVFFGLISYSLYLWHWPVVTLGRYVAIGDPGPLLLAALMAVSVLLAWASWYFVETPVRRSRHSGRVIFGGAAAASGVALAMGAVLFLGDGLAGRFRPEIHAHIDAAADFLQDFSRCKTETAGPLEGIELCQVGPEGPPQVLIWGDSHVRAFWDGLNLAADEAGVPALAIWRAGCPPLFGIGKEESAATVLQDAACGQANTRIEAALDSFPEARTLLLIGRWSYYATGTGVGEDGEGWIRPFPLPGSPVPEAPPAETMAAAWDHSAEIFARRFDDIFVLRQVPEIFDYSSIRVARMMVHGGLADAQAVAQISSVPRTAVAARAASAEAPLTALAAEGRISLIDSWPEFCTGTTCSALHDGLAGYFDNNHVTNTTARRIRHLFAPVFAAAGGDAGG